MLGGRCAPALSAHRVYIARQTLWQLGGEQREKILAALWPYSIAVPSLGIGRMNIGHVDLSFA